MNTVIKLATRLIACTLLATSLSACVTSGQSASAPLYYQPSMYGYAPTSATAMEYYYIPRR